VPPPQKLKKFFGSMCSKNFCVQAKLGGHRPVAPLNTPLVDSQNWITELFFEPSAINDFGLQDISRITAAYFNSPSMIVTVVDPDPLDLNAIVHNFAQRVDQFTRRGSG